MLRQQEVDRRRPAESSLADFVAPRRDAACRDYLGAFAVTAGLGADELARQFEAGSRRLQRDHGQGARRSAGRGVRRVPARAGARRDWGYGANEQLSNDDLIAEKYRGIRPAFGYPACPDHTEKCKLFDLLDAERQGLTLTESFAMLPAASVSGLYFAHPEAKYFNVGRIGRDQIEAYAARKGVSLETAERWLAPNLAYDPVELGVKC